MASRNSDLDYNQSVQTQFRKCQEVKFAKADIMSTSTLITWDDVERCSGANQEWHWCGALTGTAYFLNGVKVQIHPGWTQSCSRFSALVQNPGSNKDRGISVVGNALENIQVQSKSLILLDDFSMPYLYQMLKANSYRAMGVYTELDGLLQKICSKQSGGQTSDMKTRMIKIADCGKWGYGIKGDNSFTFENQEYIPSSLFPIWSAVQPEPWYTHRWNDPLSGWWQRWSEICTEQIDLPWAASADEHISGESAELMFQQSFENIREAMKVLPEDNKFFTLSAESYTQFGSLYTNIKEIKKKNSNDPVVLSEASKILREVATTMGLMHAWDQGSNAVADFETEIPVDVLHRATKQVMYHKKVALNGRPPKAIAASGFELKLDDTADTVELRRMVEQMHGRDIMGSSLKGMGVLGALSPAEWRSGPGRKLQELGLLTITKRNMGYSIERTRVPDLDTDAEAHAALVATLEEHINMTVDEYAETLEPAPRRRADRGILAEVPFARPTAKSEPLAKLRRPMKSERCMKEELEDDIKVQSLLSDDEGAALGFISTSASSKAAVVSALPEGVVGEAEEEEDLRMQPRRAAKRLRKVE